MPLTNDDTAEAPARGLGAFLPTYSKLLVGAVIVLIFYGGQVKSHDAGLAVPDWPTTYNENMFTFSPANWVGGIFHEHVHRLVASGVGLMTVILALWVAAREDRGWIVAMGFLALFAVVLQGVLGGMTVIFLLPDAISISHALLAQAFLVITVIIAYALSRERADRVARPMERGATPLARPALILVGAIYFQLLLGAVMRHTEAGLAVPDFPTMAGAWLPRFDEGMLAWINDWRLRTSLEQGVDLPPVTMGQVAAHLLHRAGALLVAAAVAYALWRASGLRASNPRLFRHALILGALVLVQITLGVYTVWSVRTPIITSIHVVTGAALLAYAALFALRSCSLSVRRLTATSTQTDAPGMIAAGIS